MKLLLDPRRCLKSSKFWYESTVRQPTQPGERPVRLCTFGDVPDLVESAIAMMRETEGVEIERNIAERGVTAIRR